MVEPSPQGHAILEQSSKESQDPPPLFAEWNAEQSVSSAFEPESVPQADTPKSRNDEIKSLATDYNVFILTSCRRKMFNRASSNCFKEQLLGCFNVLLIIECNQNRETIHELFKVIDVLLMIKNDKRYCIKRHINAIALS